MGHCLASDKNNLRLYFCGPGGIFTIDCQQLLQDPTRRGVFCTANIFWAFPDEISRCQGLLIDSNQRLLFVSFGNCIKSFSLENGGEVSSISLDHNFRKVRLASCLRSSSQKISLLLSSQYGDELWEKEINKENLKTKREQRVVSYGPGRSLGSGPRYLAATSDNFGNIILCDVGRERIHVSSKCDYRVIRVYSPKPISIAYFGKVLFVVEASSDSIKLFLQQLQFDKPD